MRRLLICVSVAVLIVAGSVAQAGQPIQRVVALPGQQFFPSSNGSLVAYEEYRNHHDNVWITDMATGKRTHVNLGPRGEMGSFVPGTNKLVYQQLSSNDSDIYFFNTVSGVRSRAGSTVNGPGWEFWPRASSDFLLFMRHYRMGGWWRTGLVLYDYATGRQRYLVRRINSERTVIPGYAGTGYVAWTDCFGGTCRVHYLDTSDQRTILKIPMPAKLADYAPAIDETAGQLYFVRSLASRCGRQVRFLRMDLATEALVTIAQLPKGIDTGAVQSLAPNPNTLEQDLYFERYNCATFGSDIYAVRSVDAV